jgi:hypothetical protein
MDLKFLRPLYRDTGGWLSVYLDTSRNRQAKDTGNLVALRWRTAREQLSAAGADAATLAALEAVLTDASVPVPGRVAFARAGEVALSRPLRMEPEQPVTEVGPLPEVMPFLAQYQPPVPRVQVTATRDGGSVVPVYGNGDGSAGFGGSSGRPQPQPEHAGQVRSVDSPWPVHKAASGGWEKGHYDRSVEHSWAEGAKSLAQLVQQAAKEVSAEYLVVAGDARGRSLLLDQLSTVLAESVIMVDAEIAADSPELAAAAESVIMERTAREDAAQLGEWRRLHAHGRAVEGLPAVVQALREGRAAEVFVPRQPLPGPAAGSTAGGPGESAGAGDAAVPETAVPGTALPGTGVPGTALRETVVPETPAPGTALGGTAVPETLVPGTAVPGTVGGRLPGRIAAFVGPASTDLALSSDDLRQQGVAEPAQTTAAAAIVRAVSAADCELRFLPAASAYPPPADHICATLR